MNSNGQYRVLAVDGDSDMLLLHGGGSRENSCVQKTSENSGFSTPKEGMNATVDDVNVVLPLVIEEQEHIRRALAAGDGNVSRAAALLEQVRQHYIAGSGKSVIPELKDLVFTMPYGEISKNCPSGVVFLQTH